MFSGSNEQQKSKEERKSSHGSSHSKQQSKDSSRSSNSSRSDSKSHQKEKSHKHSSRHGSSNSHGNKDITKTANASDKKDLTSNSMKNGVSHTEGSHGDASVSPVKESEKVKSSEIKGNAEPNGVSPSCKINFDTNKGNGEKANEPNSKTERPKCPQPPTAVGHKTQKHLCAAEPRSLNKPGSGLSHSSEKKSEKSHRSSSSTHRSSSKSVESDAGTSKPSKGTNSSSHSKEHRSSSHHRHHHKHKHRHREHEHSSSSSSSKPATNGSQEKVPVLKIKVQHHCSGESSKEMIASDILRDATFSIQKGSSGSDASKQLSTPGTTSSNKSADSSKTPSSKKPDHAKPGDATNKRKLSFDEELTTADVPSKKPKSDLSSHSTSKTSANQGEKPRKPSKDATSTPSKRPKVPGTPSKRAKTEVEDPAEAEKYLYPKRHVPTMARVGNLINTELEYVLRNHSLPTPGLKYGSLIHIERDSNGGATVVHSYADELAKLSASQMEEFVQEYFRVTFAEESYGVGVHTMGIVHASATYLPDLLEHFAHHYPDMTVKCNVPNKSDIESMTMRSFRDNVHKSYCAGTFRCGGMLSVSLLH